MIDYRQFNRDTEERTISIIEVNVDERRVIGRDQFNTPVQVSLHLLDSLVAIPQPGEVWTVVRKGSDWFLSRNGTTIGLEGLGPGDKMLHAAEDLHLSANGIIDLDASEAITINAPEVLVNGKAPGVPTGTLLDFAGAAAPDGFLLADGAAISRTTYADLFLVVGTTFGVGNGSTTFNLPDARGRATIGVGTHSDVNARGDSDGLAVGDRRPQHKTSVTAQPTIAVTTQPTIAVSGNPTFSGSYTETGTVSADHAHHTTTGGISANHQHYNPESGGGSIHSPTYHPGASDVAGGTSFLTGYVTSDHAHSGWSGGISANHIHGVTSAGTISGGSYTNSGGAYTNSGGTYGPQTNVPTDTIAYITTYKIIKT